MPGRGTSLAATPSSGGGLVLAALVMRLELKLVEKYSHYLLLACFVLLRWCSCRWWARRQRRARWINLGPASFRRWSW